MEAIELLGIDNVFFAVGHLEKALLFYQQLGFRLKFTIPQKKALLLTIGQEEPGLILVETTSAPSKLWLEVEEAKKVETFCKTKGLKGSLLETATGYTYETQDEWGNTLGFADYKKRPELARKRL